MGGCLRRYRNSKDLGRHPWHHFKAVSTFWPESAVAQCSDQFFWSTCRPKKDCIYTQRNVIGDHVESIHTIVTIGPVPCTQMTRAYMRSTG